MLLPVAPAKINTKINGSNKTMTLINDGEINLLKKAGLKEIDFDVLLPRVEYPFAVYPMVKGIDGKEKKKFVDGKVYLDEIERLFDSKEPFYFKLIRYLPSDRMFDSTEIKVSIEDYSISEEASEGIDIIVSLSLKEYRDFVTDTGNLSKEDEKVLLEIKKKREAGSSPEPKGVPKTYKVVKNDSLWGIAQKYYGDGSKYMIIANSNSIANPNLIRVGQVLTIPVL